MANTWIKLYHEILTDPKMGRMSDKLFRRTIELFLIAGKEDNKGMLPDIEDIAWMLRTSEKEIQKTLEELERLNITERYQYGYLIKHFVTRQESNLTGYEKVKRYRDNHKQVINDNPDDNQNDNSDDNQNDNSDDNPDDIEMITVDKDIDKDKDIDIDKELINISPDGEKIEKKPKKHGYGSAKNVMLTDDEYRKLKEQFPDAEQKIENMSLYFSSKGNAGKYKSHYATFLNWERMARERDNAKPVSQQKTRLDQFIEYAAELNGIPRKEFDIEL